MKLTQHFCLIGLGVLACLAFIMGGGLSKTPVHAQTVNDDGFFTIYVYMGYDAINNVWADADVEQDSFTDISGYIVEEEPYWTLSGGGYFDSGVNIQFSSGPVPAGNTYTASFTYQIEYFTSDDGEDECLQGCTDDPTGYADIYVPYPPPSIDTLSTYSVHQGDRDTLTINGGNLVNYAGDQLTIDLSGSSSPFIPTGTPTVNTATFSYDFSYYLAGTYTLSVSNNEGQSNGVTFTVVPASAPPPPLDSCDVMSNPQAKYSSIVPAGTAGSGTMTVSFSGDAFAAISPSVTYGPNSTPSSIAANIAALITKNYFQYGLTAKAFGPNVVYGGNAPLGTVSNAFTETGGSAASFTTTTSTEAGTAAALACHSAPQTPAPPSEVAIVAWINGNAIQLPTNESFSADAFFPPYPIDPFNYPSQYAICAAQVGVFATGILGLYPSNDNDKAYANAWLLKFSGNAPPPLTISPNSFQSQLSSFRAFNDYAPGLNIHNTVVGKTLDPCGSTIGLVGVKNSNSGTGMSIFGDQYQLAEVRVDQAGQNGFQALNNHEIPWVWSVIEFDKNGYPDYGRIRNASPTSSTTNYQIFPTYTIYINGKLFYQTVQGSPADFSRLPPGSQLPPNTIQ